MLCVGVCGLLFVCYVMLLVSCGVDVWFACCWPCVVDRCLFIVVCVLFVCLRSLLCVVGHGLLRVLCSSSVGRCVLHVVFMRVACDVLFDVWLFVFCVYC